MNVLGFGVLIGELEHHSADEDLAAGVCFSFAPGEARADATGSSVQLGFPCVQFGLQLFLFPLQFRQQFFVSQSHGLTGYHVRSLMRLIDAPFRRVV